MLNHTHIKRSLTVGLIAGTVAFPAAAQAQHVVDSGGVPSASPVLTAGPPPASTATSAPSTQSGGSSFQWDDAGIGAAGAAVLIGAAAVGTGLSRRRRTAFN